MGRAIEIPVFQYLASIIEKTTATLQDSKTKSLNLQERNVDRVMTGMHKPNLLQ